jgi:hypothetical protein
VSLITKGVALGYIICPLSRFTGSRINYILRMNLSGTGTNKSYFDPERVRYIRPGQRPGIQTTTISNPERVR